MTDFASAHTTAWAGFPPNPQSDGWHWLRVERYPVEPVMWIAEVQVWRGKGKPADALRMGVSYVAPCPYPEDIKYDR